MNLYWCRKCRQYVRPVSRVGCLGLAFHLTLLVLTFGLWLVPMALFVRPGCPWCRSARHLRAAA